MLKIQTKGTGPMAYSYTCPRAQQLDEVRIHLSVAGATVENLVITIDDKAGSEYDIPVSTTAMNTIQDVNYHPTRPHKLAAGDIVKIAYANTNNRTYGIDLIMQNI